MAAVVLVTLGWTRAPPLGGVGATDVGATAQEVVELTVVESIALSDLVGVRPPAAISVEESIVATDLPGAAPPALVEVFERVTTRDVPGLEPQLAIRVEEMVGVADVSGALPPAEVVVTESVNTTDLPLLLPPAVLEVFERITARDVPGLEPQLAIRVEEVVGVLDLPAAVPPVEVAVGEVIGVADLPRALPPAEVMVAEQVATRDTPGLEPQLAIRVEEVVGVSDLPAAVPPVEVAVGEVIGVADLPRALPPAEVTVAEQVTLLDGPGLEPQLAIRVDESIAVTDRPVALLPVEIVVAEAVRATDRPVLVPPIVIAVDEAVGVTDVPRAVPPAELLVSERIGTTDQVDLAPQLAIRVEETIALTDRFAALPPVEIAVDESIRTSEVWEVLPPGPFPVLDPYPCGNDRAFIPITILTTRLFDATSIDHESVRFGETGTEASEFHTGGRSRLPQRHERDVDEDGDMDLQFHFRAGDTGLSCEHTVAHLTGSTFDGEAFDLTVPLPQVAGDGVSEALVPDLRVVERRAVSSVGDPARYQVVLGSAFAGQEVTLSCSGLPAGASCTFGSQVLAVEPDGATVDLLVSLSGASAQQTHGRARPLGLLALGLLLLAALLGRHEPQRRGRLARALPVLLLIAGALLYSGCLDQPMAPQPVRPVAGDYEFTVTATAGFTSRSTEVPLRIE